MKFLLSIILISSVAVGTALVLNQGGHVTFWWSGWRVDLEVSTFLIALFFSFVIFWFVCKIIFEIFSLPEKAKKYRDKLKESKKIELVFQLFLSFFQNKYLKVIEDAEKLQKKFIRHDSQDKIYTTLIVYLKAVSADQISKSSIRDNCIQRLDSSQYRNTNSYIFIDLLKIKALLKNNQINQALDHTLQVQKKYSDNFEFLKLQVIVNKENKNWEEVLRLTRIIEKKKKFPSFDYSHYKNLSIENLFLSAENNPVFIKKVIGLIKNDYKQDAKLTKIISSAYTKIGDQKKSCEILEEFLNYQWDPSLLNLYAGFTNESKSLFKKFENWEQKFSTHWEFHFNYGKVCKLHKLWGKAQLHFEKSIEISPSVEAYVSLAEIFKILKNEKAATNCWEKAAYISLKVN